MIVESKYTLTISHTSRIMMTNLPASPITVLMSSAFVNEKELTFVVGLLKFIGRGDRGNAAVGYESARARYFTRSLLRRDGGLRLR